MYEMELPLRSAFFSSSQRSYHSQVAPEEMLLRWVNYHLRRSGCGRTLTNFSEDIMVYLTPFAYTAGFGYLFIPPSGTVAILSRSS
jgi:hypothetical protein